MCLWVVCACRDVILFMELSIETWPFMATASLFPPLAIHDGGVVPPDLATTFGGDAGLAQLAQTTNDDEAALEWWIQLMRRGDLQDLVTQREPDVNDQSGSDAVLRMRDGAAPRVMFPAPAGVLTGLGIGKGSTPPAESKASCHAPAPPDGAAPRMRGGADQRLMFPMATEAPQGLGLAQGSTQRRGDDRAPPVAPSFANAASSTRCGTGKDDYREDVHEAGTDSRMRDGTLLRV